MEHANGQYPQIWVEQGRTKQMSEPKIHLHHLSNRLKRSFRDKRKSTLSVLELLLSLLNALNYRTWSRDNLPVCVVRTETSTNSALPKSRFLNSNRHLIPRPVSESRTYLVVNADADMKNDHCPFRYVCLLGPWECSGTSNGSFWKRGSWFV